MEQADSAIQMGRCESETVEDATRQLEFAGVTGQVLIAAWNAHRAFYYQMMVYAPPRFEIMMQAIQAQHPNDPRYKLDQ
jgi:hypothetical protein